MLLGGKGKLYGVGNRGTIGLGVAEFLQAVYSNYSTICNGLAAICNANFDWGFQPQISPSHGADQSTSNTMLLGTTQVYRYLPNDISFHLTALAQCTIVTDGQTDHTMVTPVTIGGIAECFQRCQLKTQFLKSNASVTKMD